MNNDERHNKVENTENHNNDRNFNNEINGRIIPPSGKWDPDIRKNGW